MAERLSISRVKLFKACRKAYWFKYIEGLEPVRKSEALEIGTSYHEGIEALYAGESVFENQNSKEAVMCAAYKEHIFPKVAIDRSEEWQERYLPCGNRVIGRVDGIGCWKSGDGSVMLVEHKTSSSNTFDYEASLERDEQILTYMWLTGLRECIYTVCQKPTIRQSKYETETEFAYRMKSWYCTDTESKIRAFQVERTDEEVEKYVDELNAVAEEINRCDVFYRNTCHCRVWGRDCEYAQICMSYDPENTYPNYVKEERR